MDAVALGIRAAVKIELHLGVRKGILPMPEGGGKD